MTKWVGIGKGWVEVAGVTQCGNEHILRSLVAGATLDLIREPHNLHDKNAVAVEFAGKILGYLPRYSAKEVSKFGDQMPLQATVGKLWVNPRTDWVELHIKPEMPSHKERLQNGWQ